MSLFVIHFAKADLILESCENQNCALEEFHVEEDNGEEDPSGYFTGSYKSYISQDCHFRSLDHLMNRDWQSPQEMGKKVSKWFKRCEKELTRFNSVSIFSMINLARVNYPFNKNPRLYKAEFIYDVDTKVRGILALKDLNKRPLVIVKNGVFGNADNTPSVREMLMHLTEEAPFHVLILGNLTGEDFIKDNGFIAMGGFEEGRQIHEVVKILRDSSLNRFVHDIHMLGMSLGGNAAVYSALYNSYLPKEEQIASHIAYCPVVDLKVSLDRVYSPSITGFFFAFFTKGLLAEIFQFVPILRKIFDPSGDTGRKVIKQVLIEGTFHSIAERTHQKPWDYEPFLGFRVETKEQLWELNDFKLHQNEINGPLMLVHSENDFVVKSKENSNPLKQLSRNNRNIGYLDLNEGGHCAFGISYGWASISTFLRNYILEHSDYSHSGRNEKGAIFYKENPVQNARYKFSRYEWLYNSEAEQLNLLVEYRLDHQLNARGNDRCRSQDYRFSDKICYRTMTFGVDKKTLEQFGLNLPKKAFKLSYFVRWLNTNFVPVNEKGEIPYGKSETPSYVEFKNYTPLHLEKTEINLLED